MRPPLRYYIDAARRVVFIDILEVTDGEAVIGALRAIVADAAFQSAFDLYVDCGYVRRVPRPDEVRNFARACMAAGRPPVDGRTAIVGIRPDVYDVARFFAVLTGAPRERLRVFQSWSEALAWLEPTLPPEDGAALAWERRADALHDLVQRARLRTA